MGPDQSTGHARCLKDIQKDPAARAIFHSIHVLDGARLRAGFDAAVNCSVVQCSMVLMIIKLIRARIEVLCVTVIGIG